MLHLPKRRTGPPQTSRTLPHRQLDQWPPPEIQRRLLDECLALPDVRPRQSRMAPPGTAALFLPDDLARGVREAYIDQHEFCHLHPPPEGTIHLTLPQPVHRQVVELGWGEPHPMAGSGLSPNLVLIYGPRDVEELEIVLGLVVICRSFATGAIGLPAAALA
jgi:phospholipase/carboxylesterase